MARLVDEELERYRAVFCTNCPFDKNECSNCVESAYRPTRVKALKEALKMGIPEKYARGIIVGGSNICLN